MKQTVRAGGRKHLRLIAAVLFLVFLMVMPEGAAAYLPGSGAAAVSAAPVMQTWKRKKRKKNKKTSSEASAASAATAAGTDLSGKTGETDVTVEEDGAYTSKEEVALYIHTYGELPGNYITKREAEDLGWSSSAGNLDIVAPGKSIGGNRFGNYEGKLPEKKGRQYYECDIDYDGGRRNAKRIIFSNDGLIFYTEDHYNTFEQLY